MSLHLMAKQRSTIRGEARISWFAVTRNGYPNQGGTENRDVGREFRTERME
jgi:hypothetical protein